MTGYNGKSGIGWHTFWLILTMLAGFGFNLFFAGKWSGAVQADVNTLKVQVAEVRASVVPRTEFDRDQIDQNRRLDLLEAKKR